MRAFLDRGFEIPHLVLNDGSLTTEDIESLKKLPLVYLELDPVRLEKIAHKAVYLAKLECYRIGFEKYNADRIVLMDNDIFFFRNWESDLRKICMSDSIALRDWGSSLGPEPEAYKQVFGCYEDVLQPNCNTGISSIPQSQYFKIGPAYLKIVNNPDKIFMQDQGNFFASYYGHIDYVNSIPCCINGGEFIPEILNHWLSQNAAHLMGMRERPDALKIFIEQTYKNLPQSLHLNQFSPEYKRISFGLMEYDIYSFNSPLHKIPSTYRNRYITDALYLHGGSKVVWKLPPQCKSFKTTVGCMDTGLASNCRPLSINGQLYAINMNSKALDIELEIPLNGSLTIETPDGNGTHYVFLEPKITLNVEKPVAPSK